MQYRIAAVWAPLPVSAQLEAQGVRATLVGRATDQSGPAISQARITITNTGTDGTRVAGTAEFGDYTILQLAPGEYNITHKGGGFQTTVRCWRLAKEARIELVLKLGAVSEKVEVAAAALLIASENASPGNAVDQKKIVELPLNGPDYLHLAFLPPKVFATAQGSTRGFCAGCNVAASSDVSNYLLKDGIDNSDETTGQPFVQAGSGSSSGVRGALSDQH